MNEREYIIATNYCKAASAKNYIRDMMPGKEYGVDNEEYIQIVELLDVMVAKLGCRIDKMVK